MNYDADRRDKKNIVKTISQEVIVMATDWDTQIAQKATAGGS